MTCYNSKNDLKTGLLCRCAPRNDDAKLNHPILKQVHTMKRILSIIGILSIAVGLLWIGQGTGYFPYPKQSFMISQTPWIYYGEALAAFGAGLVLVSRRMR
jgi:hypothetical protein